MKRFNLLFVALMVMVTSCCLSQIPTQYAYVDADCNAPLPDYAGIVVVSDNCEIVSITQLPPPGILISGTTNGVQDMGDYWNENVAGQERVLELPDTTFYYVEDSMFYFYGTIPILEFRMDEGYWQDETPNLTAWFK